MRPPAANADPHAITDAERIAPPQLVAAHIGQRKNPWPFPNVCARPAAQALLSPGQMFAIQVAAPSAVPW